jgi:hypothetical protein
MCDFVEFEAELAVACIGVLCTAMSWKSTIHSMTIAKKKKSAGVLVENGL